MIPAVKLAELGLVTESNHADENVLQAVGAVAERPGNPCDIARPPYITARGSWTTTWRVPW